MGDLTVPALLCILVAAAATAGLIHGYVPSPAAFQFRRMRATLAVRRAIRACRHAFDGEARRLARYSHAMVDLESAIGMRDGIERGVSASAGPAGLAKAGALAEFAMLERHLERCKERARRYLSTMSDEDVAAVARVYRRRNLEDLVPVGAVEEFFRDERELVRTMPHLVVGHFDRMTHRFNALLDAAAEAPLAHPHGT